MKNKQQHKSNYKYKSNAYGTEEQLDVKNEIRVITKFYAYGAKSGFLRTREIKSNFNQLKKQLFFKTKSEFPPGVNLWQKQTNKQTIIH